MTMEFDYEFKGFGRVPTKCDVKIYSDQMGRYICFEDLGIGTSVTNASEQLASEIINEMDFDPADCRFFETYSQYNYDTLDEITYQWSLMHGKWEANHPNWKPASEEIKNLFINS